ncbi:unnamed protein product [Nippostrongylus brasiliensis]|uniref:Peptidase A2 domain-containing protein n=1 Tax=Nippostrongylus brasiliensis TaxID=27835 RepID=A0A0N4YL07_NIPBR|nr:unnamed protein product [Nippostrongylus brasiliensis]
MSDHKRATEVAATIAMDALRDTLGMPFLGSSVHRAFLERFRSRVSDEVGNPQQRSWQPAPEHPEQPEPDLVSLLEPLMNQTVTACDTAFTEQLRNLSLKKRQKILEEIQKAADAVIAKIRDARRDPPPLRESLLQASTSAKRANNDGSTLLQSETCLQKIAHTLNCEVDQISQRINELVGEVSRLQVRHHRTGLPQTQNLPRTENKPIPHKGECVTPLNVDEQLRSQSSSPNDSHCLQYRDLISNGFPEEDDVTRRFPLQPTYPSMSQKSSRSCSPSTEECTFPTHCSESFRGSCRHAPHSQCSHISRHDQLSFTLKEVLKSQVIGDIGTYDGTSSIDDFLRNFYVKYPITVWSDEDRRKIFLSHLRGTAKAMVENLPQETRHGSLAAIVVHLREARLTPYGRLEAECEWKTLRMNDGETVADFTCRLQRIAARMAPGESMDFQLGSKLYDCLSHWRDAYYMLQALEAPKGQVFSEVRRVALCLERIRIAQKALRTARNNHSSGIPSTVPLPLKDKSQPKKNLQQQPTGGKAGNRRDDHTTEWRKSHKGSNEPQKEQMSRAIGSDRHDPKGAAKTKPASHDPQQPFSTQLQSWCATLSSPTKWASTKPYGKPYRCKVKLLGSNVDALIDTGSVLSIVSTGFLMRRKNAGVDLDSLVTMLGPAYNTNIRDVSGNLMSFLMMIDTNVTLVGGKETKVQFHIQKADNALILLGTNALQSLGMEIRFRPNGMELCTNDGSKKRGTRMARAARTVTIPPLSVANIEITHPCKEANEIFWSHDNCVGSGLCRIKEGSAVVSAINTKEEPWVIHKGQNLGKWSSDPWYDPKTKDIPGDMLELKRVDVLPESAKINKILEILQENKREGVIPAQMKRLI